MKESQVLKMQGSKHV
jgi:hypothetical protein